jgi:hypothetical protein
MNKISTWNRCSHMPALLFTLIVGVSQMNGCGSMENLRQRLGQKRVLMVSLRATLIRLRQQWKVLVV